MTTSQRLMQIAFREQFGTNARTFVLSARIQRAHAMLGSSGDQMTLSEIAAQPVFGIMAVSRGTTAISSVVHPRRCNAGFGDGPFLSKELSRCRDQPTDGLQVDGLSPDSLGQRLGPNGWTHVRDPILARQIRCAQRRPCIRCWLVNSIDAPCDQQPTTSDFRQTGGRVILAWAGWAVS